MIQYLKNLLQNKVKIMKYAKLSYLFMKIIGFLVVNPKLIEPEIWKMNLLNIRNVWKYGK